jgi:hypothetical protein
MEDASKAKASIAALNDFNLKGSRIRVEVCGYFKFNLLIPLFIRYQRLNFEIRVVHRKNL